MSNPPSRRPSTRLPRLSRTSVFMPTFVYEAANPGARKYSDTVDVSPLTSQARLSNMAVDESTAYEDGELTPIPANLDMLRPAHLGGVDTDLKDRNDSTSTSATGPAGSGMPPAEAAFTCEKELVNDEDQDMLEMPLTRSRFRNTFSNASQLDPYSVIQSPRPRSALAGLSSVPDVHPLRTSTTNQANPHTRRSGASFYSNSSFDTFQSRQSTADDTADIIFHTAQTAQMKRPSLVQYSGSGNSNHIPPLFVSSDSHEYTEMPRGNASAIGRSHSTAIGDLARERSRWSRIEVLPPQTEHEALNADMTSGSSMANPQNPLETVESTDFVDVKPLQTKGLTLRDALSMNPFSSSGIPKRSTTLPSSLDARKKTRFPHLSLENSQSLSLHRESIVATPYPEANDVSVASKSEVNDMAPNVFTSKLPQLRIAIVRGSEVAICITPTVQDGHSSNKAHKENKNDDEELVRTLQREFYGLQGVARSLLGAKVAKAATVKLIRVDRADHFHRKGDPLDQEYLGIRAETDFWKLWCSPASGRKLREWYDLFAQKSDMIDPRWIIAIDVKEGFDATRIITAFSVVTALCIMAMFFWLFLGVGGEGNTMTIVDGVILRPTSDMTDVAGRAGDAFLFGVLVLFVGWTGIAGWLLASQ